ncbi:mitochondrial carrier protein [Grosmannia clavigera kw1407]|uniref:Mitochondrial carrier protein n=1 Tax=Grosmannia clavigera (strain kw1407 / UAMH 11150) TaxID=655863 RepID=F0XPB9_GROCL|nr:mitochondrial carrier protein [Grosmannia clavigera kw1407]EFX00099.1 mitochondrial carrier protein [Grosmannia clavigera kw1407]
MTGRSDASALRTGTAGGTSSINGSPGMDELFPGILPAVPIGSAPIIPDKDKRSNAATAASAAGVRALSAQALQFYFRAPVKAFFRTRVDYLAYARGPDGRLSSGSTLPDSHPHSRFRRWLRGTTPGVLTLAIRRYGWSVVPNQILPPLAANISVAAVLYTSYLQILGHLHPESGQARRRVYPPPAAAETFTAGFLAGSIQSLVAAPLDAIQARFDHGANGMGNTNGTAGRPQSMWSFSAAKLREIGLRGIFAGWGLSFLKDSFGSAVFFSTFEYVKAQGYYHFVAYYYGALDGSMILAQQQKQEDSARRREQIKGWIRTSPREQHHRHHHLHHHHDGHDSFSAPTLSSSSPSTPPVVIRPHYAIEPIFLLLAGIAGSLAQQVLLHPLTHLQVEHWDRLEDLDAVAKAETKAAASARTTVAQVSTKVPHQSVLLNLPRFHVMRTYYRAYIETWRRCVTQATTEGLSMAAWLYRGFWWNAIRQVPSTGAGLIIFELVRRKYGLAGDMVRICQDGYDILLE